MAQNPPGGQPPQGPQGPVPRRMQHPPGQGPGQMASPPQPAAQAQAGGGPALIQPLQFNAAPTPMQKALDDYNQTRGLRGQAPATALPGDRERQLEILNEERVKAGKEPVKRLPQEELTPLVEGGAGIFDQASEEASRVWRGGGLALAVVILIVLIWLLIPTASGYTRMELMWFTLLGRTGLATKSDKQSKIDALKQSANALGSNTPRVQGSPLPGITNANQCANAGGTWSNGVCYQGPNGLVPTASGPATSQLSNLNL